MAKIIFFANELSPGTTSRYFDIHSSAYSTFHVQVLLTDIATAGLEQAISLVIAKTVNINFSDVDLVLQSVLNHQTMSNGNPSSPTTQQTAVTKEHFEAEEQPDQWPKMKFRIVRQSTGRAFVTTINNGYAALNGIETVLKTAIQATWQIPINNIDLVITPLLPQGAASSVDHTVDSPTLAKAPKCECGAHKAGSNKHSDWCELYGEDVEVPFD